MTNLLKSQTDNGVVRLTLNRPDVRNAFDDALIANLTDELSTLRTDPEVRAIVLMGAGKAFSAGADLTYMQRMAGFSEEENLEDARRLAKLMHVLNGMPQATIAMVNGPAIGGGCGLVACCDIAIASENAFFALSEARLGMVPAVISPFVVAAMGARAARRYFLTGERFSARTAFRLGFVHHLSTAESFAKDGSAVIDELLKAGPMAVTEAKTLIERVKDRPAGPEVFEETAHLIARIRASDEAKEGLAAFLEKRPPDWIED